MENNLDELYGKYNYDIDMSDSRYELLFTSNIPPTNNEKKKIDDLYELIFNFFKNNHMSLETLKEKSANDFRYGFRFGMFDIKYLDSFGFYYGIVFDDDRMPWESVTSYKDCSTEEAFFKIMTKYFYMEICWSPEMYYKYEKYEDDTLLQNQLVINDFYKQIIKIWERYYKGFIGEEQKRWLNELLINWYTSAGYNITFDGDNIVLTNDSKTK